METPPLPFAVGEEDLKELRRRTCSVIGGRGFLGRSLVSRLLKHDEWIVRVADSDPSIYPDPSEISLIDALSSGRASYHQVHLLDTALLLKAIDCSSVVFYVDLMNLQKFDLCELYKIIVEGTKNVISTCRECQVRQLIFISSADVVFDGSRNILNGDESLPCQLRHDDIFMDLIAQAESLILSANNFDGLLTCALRPSNVFGPGDPEFAPLFVKLSRFGISKFIVGNGENMSDFTYCENVTHAIICVVKTLDSRMVSVAGKAFFITNLEPFPFWYFISLILEGLGYQRPMIKIPANLVWYALKIFKCMKLEICYNNHLSSTRLFHLATLSRTFDCSAAQKQLGYSPVVSMEEGIRLTIKSFSRMAKDPAFWGYTEIEEQSKAEKLLGGGKIANVLLWRDEKITFMYFLAVVALFYLFLLSGRTFATSVAQLLLLLAICLYAYGFLITSGTTVLEIPSFYFEDADKIVKNTVISMAAIWNKGVHLSRSLARGDNWRSFTIIVLAIHCLKLNLQQPLKVFAGRVVVLTFTGFYVYEQYEPQIDWLSSFLVEAASQCGEVMINAFASLATSLISLAKRCANKAGR